jgi:hypothetical protein
VAAASFTGDTLSGFTKGFVVAAVAAEVAALVAAVLTPPRPAQPAATTGEAAA